MREVVEARRKRPRRRSAAPVEQGEDAAGRPSEAGVFARLDGMLARHRAEQPPTATTPGSGLTDTPVCVSGWPGRSPLPRAGTGTAGSGPRSEPASRRRWSAGSWPRTGLSRMFPNDAGTAHTGVRQRLLPATSPTAISRLRCRREVADGHHPGSRPGTGRACLSPPVDCHDGGIVVYTAGSGPNAGLLPTGCSSRPRKRCRRERASLGAFRLRLPLPAAWMAGSHGPLRPDTVDGRQGLFPGQRRRGGVLRSNEDGIRPSRALGGAHP